MASAEKHLLLNVRAFDGNGFSTWEYRLRLILEQKDVLSVLTEAPPTDQDALQNFRKADVKARNIIVQCLDDSILEMVKDKETAKDMMDTLRVTYEKTGISSQIILQKKLRSLKYNGRGSLLEYIVEFEKTVTELKIAGGKMETAEIITQLLSGMPDTYQSVVTALDVLFCQDNSKMTLDLVKNKLLMEEERQKKNRDDGEEEHNAFAGCKMKRQFKVKSENQKNKEQGQSSYVFKGKCFNCGKKGHRKFECSQKKNPALVAENEEDLAFITEVGTTVKSDANVNSIIDRNDRSVNITSDLNANVINFVVDSGATCHLVDTNTGQFLINARKIFNKINVAKEGESVNTKCEGELNLKTMNGLNFTLKNVLECDKLTYNLLSVRKMEEAGLKVVFAKGKVDIFRNTQCIMSGHLKNGLYFVKFEINRQTESVLMANNILLHRRMGHSSKFPTDSLCEVCVKSKQTRKPFLKTVSEDRKAKRLLEIVSSDVCGPISPTTRDDKRYFVSFIDHYSHFAIIFLLKEKSEVTEKFIEFIAMAETQTGEKIKRIRCDNGGEYMSKRFKEVCKTKGILVDYTIAHNPEQNGVAERFNRTILENARCLIFDSKLDKSFWGDAVLTSVYLLNRIETSVLAKNLTPCELWYGYKPDYSKIRIFGCTSYVHIPQENRTSKLDERSKRMFLIGYCNNGYRLWDPIKKTVIRARSVIFDEDVPQELPTEEARRSLVQIEMGAKGTEAEKIEERAETERENFEENNENIRRSTRIPKQPAYLQDYDVYYDANLMYALAAEFNFDDIPKTFEEAQATGWNEAMQEELNALQKNSTWTMVYPPPNVTIIDSKWVFSQKLVDNEVKKKARLVARGFLQPITEEECYSPVARMCTLRILLALVMEYDLSLNQLDVRSAFLKSKLKSTVYMKPPDGLNCLEGQVCKLNKALYGLRESPKCWNECLNSCIINLNFTRSKVDPCLYCTKSTFLLVWVDDIIICSRSDIEVKNVKETLMSNFEIRDLTRNDKMTFLGLEIEKTGNEIKISQKLLIQKVLKHFNMDQCKTSKIPLKPKLNLKKTDLENNYKVPYKELLGSLMYIMMGTRPDLCYTICYLSRFQNCFEKEHWKILKNVLRYLKYTENFGLIYKRNNCNDKLGVYAFVDSDFAGDINDRKSTTGFILKINNNCVFWQSKKQSVVAISSCEAEYVALATCCTESLFLGQLLNDILNESVYPIIIFEDNQSTIRMANTLETKRSKHINVKYHFVRELVTEGKIQIRYVSTCDQTADLLTKALSENKFCKLRDSINIFEC